MITDALSHIRLKKTRSAFLWTCVLRAPFWAVYNLLIFVLYKDLHASPFAIALFVALRPVVALFSLYWSAQVNNRPDRLLPNVIWAGVIGYSPFMLFPFISSVPFVLFAAALFMVMWRAMIPAWMEIFKLNLPGEHKQKVFSLGSTISYLIGVALPIALGPLLDTYPDAWKWACAAAGFLGVLATFFQFNIPITKTAVLPTHSRTPLKLLFDPWKQAWQLLAEKKNFRLYHIGFMALSGGGLMIMQPALPQFFIDALGLSYTELAIALTCCKGVGFALASPLWAKKMPHCDFFAFSSLVSVCAALFPLILLLAKFHTFVIYLAYLAYGAMQGGSEISWHLSGPHFAQDDEDSSPFSSVNVLAVGLRGLFIPQIGALLLPLLTPMPLLALGSLLCLLGSLWMMAMRKKKPRPSMGEAPS